MSRRLLPALSLIVITLVLAASTDAWARAKSGGSRGSRTYSAPARPAPASPDVAPSPTPSPMQTPAPQRPGFFGGLGGFGGMLGGLLLGGLLGGLLFGAHGFGVGLLDILLVGGGLFLLFSLLRRRQAAQTPAYAMAGGAPPATEREWARPTTVAPAAEPSDLARGIGHLRTLDPTFDPAALAALASGMFPRVQQAVMARDLTALRDYLTPDMLALLQEQCDQLRSARRTNRIERVQVRGTELTEAWQETGRDYATVQIQAALLDYTVDDGTGAVVEGSRTEPQTIEEFWTFTRPVGTKPWRLSAIQTG